MQQLPPLNPLRVFEVAARLESFTAAADELGVTQSAVSRQIATLEGALGAKDHEITDIVRGMQASLLFHLCYLLDEGGDLESEVLGIKWGLIQINPDGHPLEPISGLYESVLEMDPTGREMRPRPKVPDVKE